MSDFNQVFEFLQSIEGAGYGGIAEFEIARETMRAAAASAEPVADDQANCPECQANGLCARHAYIAKHGAPSATRPAPDAEIVAAAGKMPGHVSCNPDFERGYRAGREDAEKDVRAALAKAKGGSQPTRHVPANDCKDPSSCDRHNDCMYLGCSAFKDFSK